LTMAPGTGSEGRRTAWGHVIGAEELTASAGAVSAKV
jgi:hypothetical protein